MQQKMVYAGTSYSYGNSFVDCCQTNAKPKQSKTADSYAADQIFHDLWKQGKRPQMTYFKQKRDMQRPIDVELTLLFEDVEKLTPLTPEVKEQLTHLAAAYTKDGNGSSNV